MRIRRFEAANMTGALEQVKAFLGPEAVIISTKRIQRRDSHTGKTRKMVEVVAAVDMEAIRSSRSYKEQSVQKAFKKARVGGPAPNYQLGLQEGPLMNLHQVFTHMGIEPWLQQILAVKFLKECPKGQQITFQSILSWLGRYGVTHIKTGEEAEEIKPPIWWAVIGSTGVGKTTTLAKLAARLNFKRRLKGLLVTVDTYRLGGIEQIRRYAELMDLPLEVAEDSRKLMKIFANHKDKDFVLVDTTGRSTRDPRHKEELTRLFEAVPGLKALSLLQATSKSEDIRTQIGFYSRFPIAGWTLTKVDETRYFGPFFTPLIGRRIPVSYITNGQKVPEDLAPATPRLLMQMLLSGPGMERDGETKSSSVVEESL